MALLQQRGPGGARGAHGAPGPRQVPPWASHAPMSRPAQGFKPQELAMTLWGLAALRRSPSAALLKLVMKEVTLQVRTAQDPRRGTQNYGPCLRTTPPTPNPMLLLSARVRR